MRVSISALLVFFTLLLAGCTAVQARHASPYRASPPAGQEVLPTAEVGGPLPPTITPFPPGYPWPPTEPPIPTRRPSPTPGPTPIVLGAEWAPEGEREEYVSTTVVVAPVGEGPGEIGYWEAPEAGRIWADRFTVDVHGNIYIVDVVNQRVAQFDAEGHFVRNILYPPRPEIWYPELIAVDARGKVCLYDSGVDPGTAGVKCYDSEGHLVQKYPVPSWFSDRRIRTMRVDEDGTLWVEGEGFLPSAPVIEGEPYPIVAVPLGNGNTAEVFSEERQKMMAMPGHLLDSGGTVITYAPFSNSYLYDLQGHRIYELANQRGVIAIDQWGFWYLVGYDPINTTMFMRLHKLAKDGKEVAAFDLPGPRLIVDKNGVVYCLVFDRQTKANYQVIRWQQK